MADSLGLFCDWYVVLAVCAVESAFAVGSAVAGAAPLVEEEFGLVKVLYVAGGAVEFAQADFDLLVSGWVGSLA